MKKQKLVLRSVSLICSTAILASASIGINLPAYAASANQVANTILKARILAPGTDVKARIAGDKASISTFRNKKANDKDCKIEAVLIGKTIFEMPDNKVNRLTVYFYNASNPTQYKSVSVTKGDVAAFGTGQVSKSDLLSSIQIKEGGLKDPAAAIENQLMLTAASKRTDVQIALGDNEINVTTVMPANAPTREYKYEALRIAEIALGKLNNADAYKRVNVNFFLPGKKGNYKQVTVSTQMIDALNSKVLAALNSMSIVRKQGKVSAKDIEVADGIYRKEREQLLAAIIELEELGAGVAPFIKAFNDNVENKVGTVDNETLEKQIESLYRSVKDQKDRRKAALERPTQGTTNNDAAAASSSSGKLVSKPPKRKTSAKGNVNKFAFGKFPMLEGYILGSPELYIKECIKQFNAQKGPKEATAKNNPRYVYALLWFARVLKNNDQPEKAKRFEALAAHANAKIRAARSQ